MQWIAVVNQLNYPGDKIPVNKNTQVMKLVEIFIFMCYSEIYRGDLSTDLFGRDRRVSLPLITVYKKRRLLVGHERTSLDGIVQIKFLEGIIL